MKKIAFLLILVLLFTVSCAENVDNEKTSSSPADVSVAESEGESSTEEKSSDSEVSEEPSEPEIVYTDMTSLRAAYADGEKTASPVIAEVKTVEDGRIIIAGTCEEGAKVYFAEGDRILGHANSDHGTFIIEHILRKADSPLPVGIYAVNEGKQVSDAAEERLKYAYNDGLDVASWVWVGSDGWLFFNNTGDQYTNNSKLSSRSVKRINETVGGRAKSLAAKGKKLVYVLIPNPNELYSEFMPESIVKGTVCLRDEVASALTDAGVTVINMGDTLREHMNDGFEMYHHTDSHWTEYSAYWTYVELCKLFTADGYDSSPRDISEFGFANEFRKAGDLYYDLGMNIDLFEVESTFSHIKFDTPVNLPKYKSDKYTQINDDCTNYMEFHNGDSKNKPSYLMMRDSYSIMLFDWLAERAANSYYKPLWDFEYNESNYDNVDYVIYFVCDMNLTSVIR